MKTLILLIILTACQLDISEPLTLNPVNSNSSKLKTTPYSLTSCNLTSDSVYDNINYKYAHQVKVSKFDSTIAFGSFKGNPTDTTKDGAFFMWDVSNPTSIQILGGYYGNSDQKDGETVEQLSTNNILHFVGNHVLNLDVSNPASITVAQNISYGSGVVNGAVTVASGGRKITFGGNKRGVVDAFDTTNPDSVYYLGYKVIRLNTNQKGVHAIDVLPDKRLVLVDRGGTKVYILTVFDTSGNLLPFASWTSTQLNSTKFSNGNRIGVVPGTSNVIVCGTYVSLLDCSGATPVLLRWYNANIFCAGLGFTSDGKAIIGKENGLMIIDPSSNPLTPMCSISINNSLHDPAAFANDDYVLVGFQNTKQVTVIKTN